MKHLRPVVVDTNVPLIANAASNATEITKELAKCAIACIEAIEQTMESFGLVIDDGDEIFDEYRRKLSFSGQPGVGDSFLKWVHDNRYQLPSQSRVRIKKVDDSYAEFPQHPRLSDFDLSDRKFVAVANAHPKKPPILQAADSKWWGWKDALLESGINVIFLCPDYILRKYSEKIGD